MSTTRSRRLSLCGSAFVLLGWLGLFGAPLGRRPLAIALLQAELLFFGG